MANSVLVIEDEPILGKNIVRFLVRSNYDARLAASAAEAAAAMDEFQPDLVLLDYKLPDADGLSVLRHMKHTHAGVKFVFMTGHGSIELAVEAMKQGAAEFITKPIILEELRLLLSKISSAERDEKSHSYLRRKLAAKGGLEAILGTSPVIAELRSQIETLIEAERALGGEAPPPVLISGETGTGKQLIARALHFDSVRCSGPFVEMNCAALPDQLVESELFGHERGAFTDARERKTGLIEAADGGTLFLDEIGEMALGTQAKLLKTLEDQRVRRLGSVRETPVSVRVLAATNRNLEEMIHQGTFRADLYYRLQMLGLRAPALRERGSDIILLARHFLQQKGERYKRSGLALSAAAEAAISRHTWPGNVRELRNVIERAILLSKENVIQPGAFAIPAKPDAGRVVQEGDSSGNSSLEDMERNALSHALLKAKWNVSEASRSLGISRDTLRYRIEKFGLQETRQDSASFAQ